MNNPKKGRPFFNILPVIFLALAVMGQAVPEFPGPATGETENLDEISREQLDYFLRVAGSVEILNRIDFFKPYNEAEKKRIARYLKKAAALEPDECHRNYLLSLSYNIPQDNFFSLTPDWNSLENNRTEIIFLPVEAHRWQEIWLKSFFFYSLLDWRDFNIRGQATTSTSSPAQTTPTVPKIFDTFVYINDTTETQRFDEYLQWFDRMLDHVPQKRKGKIVPYKPQGPSVKIAHLLYGTPPGRISIVYPDREVFDHSRGFKIIIFKNSVDAYVECFLRPIASIILENDPLRPASVDSDAYLSNLVMHKIAHQVGPVFSLQAQGIVVDKTEKHKKAGDDKKPRRVPTGGDQGDSAKKVQLKLVSETLGDLFLLSEELKTGVIAIHNTSVLVEQGLIPKALESNIYATYLVSLVDKIRRDLKSQLMRSYLIQFNYLLKSEAIRFNINTKKISIDWYALPKVIEELAGEVMLRYNSPGFFYRDYGQLGPEILMILDNIKDVPLEVITDVEVKPGSGPVLKDNMVER
jgi:hypothetical protein